MPYQSLYRRYRPRRFGEIRGQDHVVAALRNAVRDERVAHAYLFSGPRGTGKTSAARILAKALNCVDLQDGEPCGVCASCVSIDEGTSFDVHEHDAASNRRIEEIRELLSSIALGTPGRTKLYILDEAHMLTDAASAALLKTLEEPPGHVVFVLATTDPQKVLPTIRSRTQHLEFNLLPGDVLEDHVRWVVKDAGLDVDDDAIAQALRAGAGSARDTLSALDRIVAAGGVGAGATAPTALVDALCDRDTGGALRAVADEVEHGREPRVIGEALLGRLRDAFLTAMGDDLAPLSDAARVEARAVADRMTPPAITRAMEALGEALIEIRQAPDPRIPLEVALVRLTRPETDPTPAALLERLDRLERAVLGGETAPMGAVSTTRTEEKKEAEPGSGPARPADGARQRLAETKRREPEPASAAPGEQPAPPAPEPEPPPAPAASDVPDRDRLTLAWGDEVLDGLRPKLKALFAAGRFLEGDGTAAVFALPNGAHRDRCEPYQGEVEEALAKHFGTPVPIRLSVDDGSHPAAAQAPAAAPEAEEAIDVASLQDADVSRRSDVDRVTDAFGGGEVVEPE